MGWDYGMEGWVERMGWRDGLGGWVGRFGLMIGQNKPVSTLGHLCVFGQVGAYSKRVQQEPIKKSKPMMEGQGI